MKPLCLLLALALAALGALAATSEARSQTPPRCPPNFNALPFSQTYPSNGVARDPGNGTMTVYCYYAMDRLGSVSLNVIWHPKADTIRVSTCGTPSRGTGLRNTSYVEYSLTREAYFSVATTFGSTPDVYPATVDEIKTAGRALLAVAEQSAVPCVRPSSAQPAAPVATPAPAVPGAPTVPSIGGAPPGANVLPDEAYQDPVVGDDGLAASVLKPGSELPDEGQAAAAAAAVAVGAAAVGASELSRRRRRPSPVEGMATGVIHDRVKQIGEDEARRVLRRALPRHVVDNLGDPIGALTALTTALAQPQNLGRTIRETLVNEPRAVEALLGRHGISPPVIAALGGPKRVVKIVSRILRNPPRAIAEGFRDAIDNLSKPKQMLRRIGNAVERVIDSTPLGLVKGLFKRPRRPSVPGGAANQVSTQRISDAPVQTSQEPLPTRQPEALREEDMYPSTASDSEPGSGP